MSAYYNEIDPYAAQWLRNLIAKGLIADGEVDTRSIIDVSPDDLRGFIQSHFFAGIGGWSYALRLAGWQDDRPIWTGSCPCQPFSVAGKGAGTDDPRHLWPHFHRLITAVRPPVVMGEQVAGAAGYGWLDGVRADLEREGYASRGVDIPACSVNAPHIRQRLYWIAVDKLANANDARFQGTERRRSARAEGEPAGHPTECDSGDMADASIIGRKEWERQDGQQDTRGVSKSGVDVAGADQSDVADAPNDGPILRTNSDGGWETHERRGDDNLRGERVGFGSPVCSDVEDSNGIRWLDGKHTKDGRQTRAVNQSGGGDGSFWSDHVWLTGADGKSRRVEPSIPLLAYGIPNRVGRLRAYGNAIVPPLAAEVIRAFMECEA